MDFEFTDDQLDLRDNVRSVLASACPPSLVRSVFDGDRSVVDGLWKTIVSLDWPATAIAESDGGLGLGFLELGIVVEELGRVVAPSPFLATTTQLAPLLMEAGEHDLLGSIASGDVTGTLALAENGRWDLDAVTATARADAGSWVLDGTKTHVFDASTADRVAVVARGDAGLGVWLVDSGAVETSQLDVIDPTMPLGAVTLAGVAADQVLVEPGDPHAETIINRAVEQATTALTLSTVATCRAIFETTLQYAKDREQFGRPIGSFQALKHRLADMFLAVERATALAYFAALTIAEDDGRRAIAVSMAKAAAGDCQRLLAGDGLQLHGGIGFTWEHDLHFLLKRAKTGDLLFGSANWHRAHLARLLGLAS